MCRVSFSLTLYPDKGFFLYPYPTLPCKPSTLTLPYPVKFYISLPLPYPTLPEAYPDPTLPCKISRILTLTLPYPEFFSDLFTLLHTVTFTV